jgi:hypothetical protein
MLGLHPDVANRKYNKAKDFIAEVALEFGVSGNHDLFD